MAREHARIWLDINDDDDFQGLSFDAQGFYTRIVLTEPTLNYCGVFDWRPQRLTVRAPDLTLTRILSCAAELEVANYLLFDLETEEAMARSYIRRDELIRNPKMAATVIKAYPAVASKTLRAAVITEIRRIRDEHPDYSSWSHKDTADGLSRLLSKTPLREGDYQPQIAYPNPVPNTYAISVKNGYPYSAQNGNPNPVCNAEVDSGPDNQSFSVPNPSTSTLHPSPAPLGGYVSGERHQGTEPAPHGPPPPCPHHPNGTTAPCRFCQAVREHHEALEAEQRQRDLRQRADFWAEVRDCPECGPQGQVDGPGGFTVKCPNHDWGLIHA
jgi:hypothetical protein